MFRTLYSEATFTKPKSPSSNCANGQFNHCSPWPPLKWNQPPHTTTTKPAPTYPFGYLKMMSLSIPGAGRRPCAYVKEGSQGHYSLIRPLWSASVISSAWGLTRATSTISHFPLSIYPSDNHPDSSTGAEAVWQPPQHCLRWALRKSLDGS